MGNDCTSKENREEQDYRSLPVHPLVSTHILASCNAIDVVETSNSPRVADVRFRPL
jgi:hypothetical protein